MKKYSKTLIELFNMADTLGLYCQITKQKGEVENLYVDGLTLFPPDHFRRGIHDSGGKIYTKKELEKYVKKGVSKQ